MIEGATFPAEVASIALFNMLSVSLTDIPEPAADSLEAAICCNDRAKGSKAALAAGAAAGAGFGVAVGAAPLGAAVAVGLRLANEGSTLPVIVGLMVVGSRPRGCVPGPFAAEDTVALLSLSEVAIEDLSVDGTGDVRLFLRLSLEVIEFRDVTVSRLKQGHETDEVQLTFTRSGV